MERVLVVVMDTGDQLVMKVFASLFTVYLNILKTILSSKIHFHILFNLNSLCYTGIILMYLKWYNWNFFYFFLFCKTNIANDNEKFYKVLQSINACTCDSPFEIIFTSICWYDLWTWVCFPELMSSSSDPASTRQLSIALYACVSIIILSVTLNVFFIIR